MMASDGGIVIKPQFKPEFFRELARENPFGLTLHWREVEAWFEYICWPAYKTYNYKRHRLAVRRWWARCSMRDLDRAREAMDNVKFERVQKQQDQMPDLSDDDSPYDDTLRVLFGGKGVRSE